MYSPADAGIFDGVPAMRPDRPALQDFPASRFSSSSSPKPLIFAAFLQSFTENKKGCDSRDR
jgi:hypothetical protein